MCLPLRCIQPQLGTSPIAFFTSCCRLADSLVLKLPPVAAEPLLLRAVTEMALPQVCGCGLSLDVHHRCACNTRP
jgi:hypothetical protein